MCFKKYIKSDANLIPLKAEKDIVVYKILNDCLETKYLPEFNWFKKLIAKLFYSKLTPYQGHLVVFFINKAVLKAKFEKDIMEDEYDCHKQLVITKGIHSYTRLSAAICIYKCFLFKRIYSSPVKIYKAVIPKGTEYYVNDIGEAVSTKLVVYKEPIK